MAKENKYYKVEKRDPSIKAAVIRREGKTPGVIYGGSIEEGQPIMIENSELLEMFRNNTKSSVIDIELDGDKGQVIIREIQKSPVGNEPIHVDLQAIRRNEVLTMQIPIVLLGEEEVKYRELLVNPNLTTIDVSGPANKMPESIELDLTGKTPEDKFLVGDLELPEGIELKSDPEAEIVSISESKMEAEVAADEEAAEAAAEAEGTEEAPESDAKDEAEEDKKEDK